MLIHCPECKGFLVNRRARRHIEGEMPTPSIANKYRGRSIQAGLLLWTLRTFEVPSKFRLMPTV
jgi:hypothetical protein